jgi:hypothetical protein
MSSRRISALAAAAALAAGTLSFGFTCARASAAPDCSSNKNLWHVHRRLDGAISQLQHDERDYGGHRAAAVDDLVAARGDLVAAEQYAVNVDHDDPSCFQASGPTGGTGGGTRGQGGSNYNIANVGRWVGRLTEQLQNDQRDYGGHRAAAVAQLQKAQAELNAAEQYAAAHGY